MADLSNKALLSLPFDQYQRYRLMAQLVQALRKERPSLKLLDVGGYLQGGGQEEFVPAREFLPGDDVTVLDVKYSGPGKYVVGSGSALPFANRSFHIVVAMDTLEHIHAIERSLFIRELCRVSANAVIIIGPVYSPDTVLAEELLDRFIIQYMGKKHPALAEHLEYGLPTASLIRDELTGQGMTCQEGVDGFLPNWLFMMILKHILLATPDGPELNRMLDRFYNVTLSESDRRAPAYRGVFVGSWSEMDDGVTDLLNPSSQDTVNSSEAFGYTMANLLAMQENTRTLTQFKQFLDRNPPWDELMNLAEERLRLIQEKDIMIDRQLYLLSERDDYVRRLSDAVRHREHQISVLDQQIAQVTAERNKFKDILEKQQPVIDELVEFRKRILASRFFKLYKIFNKS